jgi:hypothetical protein
MIRLISTRFLVTTSFSNRVFIKCLIFKPIITGPLAILTLNAGLLIIKPLAISSDIIRFPAITPFNAGLSIKYFIIRLIVIGP